MIFHEILEVMSEDQKKELPRIRTFAQDVERQREKSGQSSSTKIATPSEVVQVLAAPAPFKNVSKKVTPEVHPHAVIETVPTKGIVSPALVNVSHKPKIIPIAPVLAKKVSVRTKKHDLAKPQHVPGGTIITDGKRGGEKLIPSIVSSIVSWFTSLQKEIKKKPVPTYTIVETERRKGIIQKATSKSGAIFTADNETLRAAILKRQATDATPKLEEVPEINWSPNIETGYALLSSGKERSSDPHNVKVEFKKTASPLPIIIEPAAPIFLDTHFI